MRGTEDDIKGVSSNNPEKGSGLTAHTAFELEDRVTSSIMTDDRGITCYLFYRHSADQQVEVGATLVGRTYDRMHLDRQCPTDGADENRHMP
jgi:hypothetical protein